MVQPDSFEKYYYQSPDQMLFGSAKDWCDVRGLTLANVHDQIGWDGAMAAMTEDSWMDLMNPSESDCNVRID